MYFVHSFVELCEYIDLEPFVISDSYRTKKSRSKYEKGLLER